MKSSFLLLLWSLSFSIALAQPDDEKEIRDILRHQETAWNNGNLEQFMVGYWDNDSMMFIGNSGITYGYQQTLDRYKKTYGDTIKMGKFTSTLLYITKISSDAYFVVGKWHLKRSIGDAEGVYTLVFRKIKGHWLIVADHSS